MNIHSFLLAFLLMLLLPIEVFGAPKISGNEPPKEQNAEEGTKVEIDLTVKQMSIYTGNIKNYMARKCPNIEKYHLGTKETPFWSNELMDEIKKCIDTMKIAGLVDEFFKKSGQQQQAEQKLVVKGANEFLEKLLEKVLQKIPGKEKIPMKQQELEKLSNEQQLLILRELFVVGELFEKNMEEDGSIGKEQNGSNGQKEFNFKFNVAVFLTEKKLQDIKTKVFLRFDLKQYFVFTEELPKHEALTDISLTKQEMTIFVQKLNNFISEMAKDCIKTGVTIPNTFKQNIAQVNIGNLVNEFDEKNQNQHPEQFLKKLLPKLLEKLLKKEIISIDQELKNLKNTQHVYILRELLVIGEHLEEKLEEYGGIGREKIGYGNTVIDFGYHAELKAQLSIAKNMTDEILKYISDFPSFDLNKYYVVHLPTNVPKYEQTQIKAQLSLGQIAVFIENMDNFLQSKCLVNETVTEDKVKKTELKKCISELKILEIRNFFKNESTKGQQQQKTNDFLESILEKISDSSYPYRFSG